MLNLMSNTISLEKERLLSACNKTADARFATFLLGLSKRYSTLGYPENQIYLSMSRQEMGNYLGLTSETVSRIITRFQNNKLISVNQKEINISDMTKFENICTSIYH
jgi:CRP/FNR family transcriptional regulator, anaerobic regulatory protein